MAILTQLKDNHGFDIGPFRRVRWDAERTHLELDGWFRSASSPPSTRWIAQDSQLGRAYFTRQKRFPLPPSAFTRKRSVRMHFGHRPA